MPFHAEAKRQESTAPWVPASAAAAFMAALFVVVAHLEGQPFLDGTYSHALEIVVATALAGVVAYLAVRLRANRIARRAEARIVNALGEGPFGVAIFDGADRLVSFNAAYADFCYPLRPVDVQIGVTYEDLLRRYVAAGAPTGGADPEAWVKSRVASHRAGGAAREILFPNGKTARVRQHRLAGGGILTIITDISELKDREQAVEKNAIHLRTLVESLDHGVALYDENWRIVAANERFAEVFGLPARLAELGRSLEDILRMRAQRGDYGAVDPERAVAERFALAQKLEPHNFEQVLPDGRVIDLKNIKLPQGGMVSIAQDITARKHAEEGRARSEAYFRMMADNAPVMVWVADSNGKVNFFNRRWLEFRGGSLETELAMPWEEIVHPEDVSGLFSAFEAAVATRQTYTHEYRLRRHDGAHRWVMSTAVPRFEADGSLGGFVGSAVDITERKHDEDLLRAAKDQAVATSRTKSELLANMSHELRTPLNAIIGFSEIMKGEMFGPLGHDSYKEYASDIYESGRHLLTLINDILDVSKAEAGRIELEEELVELRPVIEACGRLVKARAESGEVTLAVKLPDIAPKLVADERRLKQILLNLLSNAVKFTLPGGRVQVEASVLPGGELALAVADTGIGIAPEDIPRVLAPFGQVESGLNRKYEGTGLGLTLTKALIELHGGRLDIDSVRGVGTKASAIFPAARVRPHDSEAEPAQGRGRLRRLKVASGR